MINSRRDPRGVTMFTPYCVGDIAALDGKDWTVRSDMPGWYLTTTGNWRGQHPTIHSVKSMADLIREVEQAATAQPAGDAQDADQVHQLFVRTAPRSAGIQENIPG